MSAIKHLVILVGVALSVAFFTLMERKVLSYMQLRKGPNKAGMAGWPLPLGDALKLFSKEFIFPKISNKLVFLLAPLIMLVVSFLLWSLYHSNYSWNMELGLLFFLCVSSLSVYGIMLSGWSSNSGYSVIGSIRGVAQTISYEVSMAMILMLAIILNYSLSASGGYMNFWFMLPPAFMWTISCLAETNRSPFDLAEGESELVSGFNIEFGATGFALMFIAEYASILLMSLVSAVLWTGFIWGGFLFFAFFFLWARATYPRIRYDKLMSLMWKVFLSLVMAFLCLLVPLLYM